MPQTVKEKLGSLPRGSVVHVRLDPGNAGDSLIAAATFRLFEELGLEIRPVSATGFDSSDKIVMFGGGGNLIPRYRDAADFIELHHRRAREFILLPHTVEGHDGLLASLGPNTTLFAREEVTLAHLQRVATNCTVSIDHDLALALDPRDLLSAPSMNALQACLLEVWRRMTGKGPDLPPRVMVRTLRLEHDTPDAVEVGNFFRTDSEASGAPLPEGNADVSAIFELGTQTDAGSRFAAKRLLAYIDRFARVRTDRLHVCIGAALLGKPVEFYPNSYFKCRAVYEYSLRDRFPNIEWRGEPV